MATHKNDNDLDDILQSALDDFDEDDDVNVKESEESTPLTQQTPDEVALQDMQKQMEFLMKDLQNPDFQKSLEEAFRTINKEGEEGGEKPAVPASPAKGSAVDKTVAETLHSLQEASKEMEGMESAQMEQMGEAMMNQMMKELEGLGDKEDFQDVIDGMMKQLLSKDVMYEPIKQICERYPAWLAEKEPHLSKEEYERFGKQYQYFQMIVTLYDSEPENFARLMELMQDMQEYGQPPAEIVKELAPGLQFDKDGMPVMPNMGPGMMPPIPGMGLPGMGLPGMEGMKGEDCSIM